MRKLILIFFLLIIGTAVKAQTPTPPSSYTTNYQIAMWAQGANPGATALNNNSIIIDAQIKGANDRIDEIQDDYLPKSDSTRFQLRSSALLSVSDTARFMHKADSIRFLNKSDSTRFALRSFKINGYPFSGDVTISATDISSGTLATARLPSQVPLKTQQNTFDTLNTFDDVSTKRLFSPPVTVSGTDIDCSLGNIFIKSISTGANTLTFSNLVAGQVIMIRVLNTGAATLSFSNSALKWSNNTAPTQSVSNKYDEYTFKYDGTYLSGAYIQNYTP